MVYLGLILPVPRELWSQLFGGFTLEWSALVVGDGKCSFFKVGDVGLVSAISS